MGHHCSTYQIKHMRPHRHLRPQSPLLIHSEEKRHLFPSLMFRWMVLRLMRTKTSLSTLLQYVGGHYFKILVPQLVVPRPRAPAVIFAFHTRSYEASQPLVSSLTAMERRCRLPTPASVHFHPARGPLA